MADTATRRLLRRGIRGMLSLCPPSVAGELYRQLRGTCKRLGAPMERPSVSLRTGGQMILDLSDYTQRSLYYCGLYEPDLIACLSRHLSPGGVFVDAGANVGYYTLWAARRVGSAGRVHSFEPHPKTFADLKANIEINRLENVWLYDVALGDREAAGWLKLETHDAGLSYLVPDAAAEDGLLSVRIRSLEDCLPADERIDVLKIDVEGAETAVIQGARRFLESANPPYLLIEVTDWMLERLGSSEEALMRFLCERGYRAFDITPSGALRPYELAARRAHNLFFVPEGRL